MDSAALEVCLKAGFINYQLNSDARYLPKILTNNSEKQVKVLEPLLYELEKCDDFFFSVAFVTNTGVACLVDILKELEGKGIKGKILASQYQNFTEPSALRKLISFPNLEVKMITENYNFHAKGYMFHKLEDTPDGKLDNYNMIIGSSNLTQTALTVNREWNVQLSSLENGAFVRQMKEELDRAWNDATVVDDNWINQYDAIYRKAKSVRYQGHAKIINLSKINPNKMQVEALKSLELIREEGKDRALLISATGTGKTYLSAFDVRKVNPKRFLFVVHRGLIAKTALESYQRILDSNITMGMFSGNHKDTTSDYIFSTVQTLEKNENLQQFNPDTFDYIVIDEVHRAGAKTYQKILKYFKPKFLLGMTATPERTDGYDIFGDFNYNIAYEIRLNQALEENMLVPFHYHGVSEIVVDGKILDDHSDFTKLVCEERVKHILKYADFYGYDGERVKGLVFCSRKEEAEELACAFCRNGKHALALTGDSTEYERKSAIKRLENDENDPSNLDYIFTVDIFNEGVDIPSVNQLIMLRPTQSAIIFVQQLGRGLRKANAKRYLEVIDFIGNYENNYLLPIALFGDNSYRKEHVRRVMHNNYLPGASTVHFDDVCKERIFNSLNNGRMAQAKELKNSYELVKYKLGKEPLMMDFVNFGDKDPYLFVEKEKSYFEYRHKIENDNTTMLPLHRQILKFLSVEIINGKRLEEIALLQELETRGSIDISNFIELMFNKYKVNTSLSTIPGVLNVLSMSFFKDADIAKYGNIALVNQKDNVIKISDKLKSLLENYEFKMYFDDALEYGKHTFLDSYDSSKFQYGFKLYSNYSRKDACRILNWEKDTSSTVYGYRIHNNICPIFVTYEKNEDISATTKYTDSFVSPKIFNWMTRSRVKLDSKEVIEIKKESTLKLLFIKKSDGDGTDFYFMGSMNLESDPIQTTIKDDKGNDVPIVNIRYNMDTVVDDRIYSYFE